MTQPLIRVRRAGVAYPVAGPARSRSIAAAAAGAVTFGSISRGEGPGWIRALGEIDLDVMPRDRIAVIGGNGAGKTTLLRLLAGVLLPRTGQVEITGQVRPMLSLGAGLEPEKTGRENLVLLGRLLGLAGDSLRACVDEAGDASGLGRFLDLPVRTYSAGMQARLTFSLATTGSPQILVIDEVIGAGDATFLARAGDRMRALCDRASALVMASHSLDFVQEVCTTGVWLEAGRIIEVGPVDSVVQSYRADVSRRLLGGRDSAAAGLLFDPDAPAGAQDRPPHVGTDPVPSFGSVISQACTASQFAEPGYARWCEAIREQPRLHRRQWEYCYTLQALDRAGLVGPGRRGVGFGATDTPLPAVLAAHGVAVLATQADPARARALGPAALGWPAEAAPELNSRQICPDHALQRLVTVGVIDPGATAPPGDGFDFCWSGGLCEHLGSIRAGLDFIEQAMAWIRPGGWAVHITEYNCTSDLETVQEGVTVLFRRQDIEALAQRLRGCGHEVQLTFNLGDSPVDRHVDLPPFCEDRHLKLKIGDFASTSFGLLIRKRP